MKRFFMFSGQGAQYVGMGRFLFDGYAEARAVFDMADAALDAPLTRLILEGPPERLMETENTQPAILAVALATLAVLRARGIEPDGACGLSLGEYGALVAAGALDAREAFPLVRDRGRYMQQAVPLGTGGMLAVLGLDAGEVEALCSETTEGIVEPANYNCPKQVVVAGDRAGLDGFAARANERGARRLIPLDVSAPFHCSLLRPASLKLQERLAHVAVSDPKIPVYANVTARPVRTAPDVVSALIAQVSHPVRLEASFRLALEDGASAFYEIGPGRTLSGFVRKIDRSVPTYHTDTQEGLDAILAQG